jgi:hypothetical protein
VSLYFAQFGLPIYNFLLYFLGDYQYDMEYYEEYRKTPMDIVVDEERGFEKEEAREENQSKEDLLNRARKRTAGRTEVWEEERVQFEV